MSETGLHTRFRSLYRQSLPGTRINEDGCGLHGAYAWIVDGATGISDRQIMAAPSDAAWLAGLIEESLIRSIPTGATDERILTELQSAIEHAFEAAIVPTEAAIVPTAESASAIGPSACLGLIGVGASRRQGILRLSGSFLGDVVALVPAEGRILRWTDDRAKPFERLTLAALGTGGHRPDGMAEHVRQQILENRSKLNQPDGYWVVNPRRPWAGSALRFEADVEVDAPIVLATDGFMRLVDVFGIYTDVSLHEALARGRGDELLGELRERERRDETGRTFKRVKAHDDATVLVISAQARS